MSIALGLLDLGGGLHSAAVKVLCAHEGQNKVGVLVVQQSAKQGHERYFVLKVLDTIDAGLAVIPCEGLRTQLVHTSKSNLDTRHNSRECLLSSFGNGEEVVVHAEAHARHVLDVHRNKLIKSGYLSNLGNQQK
jgi:hypothetical protein